MQLRFDVVSDNFYIDTLDLGHIIPEEFLEVSNYTSARFNTMITDNKSSRVPSPKTFLVIMPDVLGKIKLESLVSENVIVVLDRFNPEEYSLLSAMSMATLHMAKGIACDYKVHKDVASIIGGKRWIDITGVSLGDSIGPEGISTKLWHIDLYSKKGALLETFLTDWVNTAHNKIDGQIILTYRDNPPLDIVADNTIAITTATHSPTFMTTLATMYPLVVYPLDGKNGSDVAMLDSRGASATMSHIATLEENGLGKTKSTLGKLEDMMQEIGQLVRSLEKFPYIRPSTDHIIVRLFNEINRSSF